MPQTVYRKVVAEDGTESFEEVQVPTQEELDAAEEARKKANFEAMQRRHELERLKGNSASDPRTSQAPKAEVVTETPVAQTLDIAALTEAAAKKVAEMLEAKTAAERSHNEQITAILKKNGLPESYRSVLEGAKDPVVTAEALAATNLNFAGANAGASKSNAKSGLEAIFAGFRKNGMVHPDDPDQSTPS